MPCLFLPSPVTLVFPPPCHLLIHPSPLPSLLRSCGCESACQSRPTLFNPTGGCLSRINGRTNRRGVRRGDYTLDVTCAHTCLRLFLTGVVNSGTGVICTNQSSALLILRRGGESTLQFTHSPTRSYYPFTTLHLSLSFILTVVARELVVDCRSFIHSFFFQGHRRTNLFIHGLVTLLIDYFSSPARRSFIGLLLYCERLYCEKDNSPRLLPRSVNKHKCSSIFTARALY